VWMAKRVVVVGAGAGGLIAAGRAAELGADVVLLEKMDQAGKKILVSGKSRCNITNAAPLAEFLTHYGRNGRFLMNAYHRFFRDELLALLARHRVGTQTERGGRIFPVSGEAGDVRDALLRYCTNNGVDVRYRSEVSEIVEQNGRVKGIRLANASRVTTGTVILATGGASWPDTGSTGQGYLMAQSLGHTIKPLRPALVPLTCVERAMAKRLQGVSLRNVRCTFFTENAKGKVREMRIPYPVPQTGEMLFTHFGVSGPLILTASGAVVDVLRRGQTVSLSIDLKPGMDEAAIHSRLQREFEEHSHQRLATLLRGWVPASLAEVLADLSGIEADRHVHRIRAEEREGVVRLLKDFRWSISGSLPLVAGMVTAGGVALNEVDPLTFASKKVDGLYIVGELLDLAADTGGYNLQAAFTTGYLAGSAAIGDV